MFCGRVDCRQRGGEGGGDWVGRGTVSGIEKTWQPQSFYNSSGASVRRATRDFSGIEQVVSKVQAIICYRLNLPIYPNAVMNR